MFLVGKARTRDDLLDFNIRNDEGKAILGDLKSGYLNSFGAFIVKDCDRQKLQSCQSMEELYLVMGSQAQFQAKVTEFDEKNMFLIQLYQHHLKTLEKYLLEAEKGLLSNLEPLTEVLYWRKTSGKK